MIELGKEVAAAIAVGVVTAVAEFVTKSALKAVAVAVRKRLEAKRKSAKAKHFATRQ